MLPIMRSAASLAFLTVAYSMSATACLTYEKSCIDHYVECQESGLRFVKDGPNQSRCQTCLSVCNQTETWPRKTNAGGTCEYWMYRGGPLSLDDGGPPEDLDAQ
jgi:hypothetical protein